MPTLAHPVFGTIVFRAALPRMMDGGEFIQRVVAIDDDRRAYALLDDRGTNPAQYVTNVPPGDYTLVVQLHAIGFFGPVEAPRTLTARVTVLPAQRTFVDQSRMVPAINPLYPVHPRWRGPPRRWWPTRTFSPAGDAALSGNARMILALRAPPIDRAPSGLPVATPFPQWCKECVRIDPTVQPVDRLRILNGYCDYAVTLPFFQETARRIYDEFTDELGREPSATEMLQRLMESTHDLVDYLPDPEGEEIFQPVLSCVFNLMGRHTSRLTGMRRGGDDCEGLATVFVTLARLLGFRASNVWWEQEGAKLNHVAAQVCDGGAWPTNFGSPRCIPIETTIPGALPNETPYEAIARIGPAYRERVYGTAA